MAERVETTAGGGRRDAHLDNIKVVLLCLVVIGHTTGYAIAKEVPLARDLYYWMYLFHMPAFVALTGLLSRWEVMDGRRAGSLVTKLLAPYAVFVVIYDVWGHLTLGEKIDLPFDRPPIHLWYLVSLFCWRLATPLLLRLRHPLLVAVAISLAAPLSSGTDLYLSASRTLGYLPFFVLGLVVPRDLPSRLRRRPFQVLGVAALAVTLAAVVLRAPTDQYPSWLYWTAPYDYMGQSALHGIAFRLVLIAVGVVLTASVVAITPARGGWWSTAGRYSIYPYLLHVLLIRLYWASPLYGGTDTVLELAVVVAACCAVVPLLALPWVRTAARPLVEPPVDHLLLRGVAPSGSAAQVRHDRARAGEEPPAPRHVHGGQHDRQAEA